jgi:hypothetical protein
VSVSREGILLGLQKGILIEDEIVDEDDSTKRDVSIAEISEIFEIVP